MAKHSGWNKPVAVRKPLIESSCCDTLRLNRPRWNVREGDLAGFDGRPYEGADLLAGGLPCPPFSVAGKQLGAEDERNLFPVALRLADESVRAPS